MRWRTSVLFIIWSAWHVLSSAFRRSWFFMKRPPKGGTPNQSAVAASPCRRTPNAHLSTRAVPRFITFSTSDSVAIVVSPGVVIASAPCAAPHSTAHCGPLRPKSRRSVPKRMSRRRPRDQRFPNSRGWAPGRVCRRSNRPRPSHWSLPSLHCARSWLQL